jgi:hypothetical protein
MKEGRWRIEDGGWNMENEGGATGPVAPPEECGMRTTYFFYCFAGNEINLLVFDVSLRVNLFIMNE